MLKRMFPILVFGLIQFGCGYEYGDRYEVETLGDPLRQRLEREKQEFVQIEDLKIGGGPVAAWGRKVSAHVRVLQTDGTFVYEGAIFDLIGFKGMPEAGLYDPLLLPPIHRGI